KPTHLRRPEKIPWPQASGGPPARSPAHDVGGEGGPPAAQGGGGASRIMSEDPEDPKDESEASKRRAEEIGTGPSARRGYPLRRASDFGSVLVVDDDADAVEILCRMLGMQKLMTIPA